MDAVCEVREALYGLVTWLEALDVEDRGGGPVAECVETWAADLLVWLDLELDALEGERRGDLQPLAMH